MRRAFLAAALAAACTALPAAAKDAKTRTPEVQAEALVFNPDKPSQTRVGRLTWLGGLRLWSKHWLFGGFSALEISPDGASLISASDRATWWSAALVLNDGIPVGIGESAFHDMPDAHGQALEHGEADSEGLATGADGSVYVSFERDHRIVRFVPPDPANPNTWHQSRPEPLPSPPELTQAPNNAGLEAIAFLKDGTLFALTESLPAEPGYNRGWLIRGGKWEPFAYRRTEPFDPTDAALLPNGDLLVLERRFSMLGGLGARLCAISAADLTPGAKLECRTVAEMAPPQSIDNMEGLAVRRNEKGETIVYIISDDNFSRIQRTVLLVFRLEPETPGP
ncbi:MAG: esterase-like activity of phytase family protein [Sphingomonadales bacterium]